MHCDLSSPMIVSPSLGMLSAELRSHLTTLSDPSLAHPSPYDTVPRLDAAGPTFRNWLNVDERPQQWARAAGGLERSQGYAPEVSSSDCDMSVSQSRASSLQLPQSSNRVASWINPDSVSIEFMSMPVSPTSFSKSINKAASSINEEMPIESPSQPQLPVVVLGSLSMESVDGSQENSRLFPHPTSEFDKGALPRQAPYTFKTEFSKRK